MVTSMNTQASYRFFLDKSSKKFKCPSCGEKKFVLYVDSEGGDYVSDMVGRCDRENRCGHHYTPKQHFTDNNIIIESKPQIKPVQATEKPIDFIPLSFLESNIKEEYKAKNNLYKFLQKTYGQYEADEAFKKYLIGTSSRWQGANIYWQIDSEYNIRQAKVMLLDSETGKRVNQIFIGKELIGENKNLQQCFWGEHLINERGNENKVICITESEKTAVIASILCPDYLWLATGAATGGCKWREYSVYKVLKNRIVVFYPDYGFANKKTGLTCFDEWTERVKRISEVMKGNFIVSKILEEKLSHLERDDQDLADVLTKEKI